MMRQRFWAGSSIPCRVVLAVACLTALTGCSALRLKGARRAPPPPKRRSASRGELLLMIQENMSRLATLKAKAAVNVIRQDVLVAASMGDERRRQQGKSYRKTFFSTEVNGFILLSRLKDEPRRVRFSGTVTGPNTSFSLLGVGDKFWITMPNVERDPDDNSAPRMRMLVGTFSREDERPKDKFSVRPQDILSLLLHDEVYPVLRGDPDVLCYRETWQDFYVLTFLRIDWPDHILSRIWIERKDLHVAIHQIFDRTGGLVAEARFRNYRTFRRGYGDTPEGSATAAPIEVPIEMIFIWPRDHLVMEVRLAGAKINEQVQDRHWKPRIPKDCEIVRLQAPEKPSGP